MQVELWVSLQLVATVITSGCFVLSGIAKLREGAGTAATFEALSVPKLFHRTWVHRLYPWVELFIGLGVLLAPGGLWWVFACGAALMLAALTWFVARVLMRQAAVECNCFGSNQPVTKRTLARNIIFLGFSLILLVPPLTLQSPVIDSASMRPSLLFAVFLASSATIVLSLLSRSGRLTPAGAETFSDRLLELPDLEFNRADGTAVSLLKLTANGPMLLVHVKEGCSSCDDVVSYFEGKTHIADRVAVLLFERGGSGDTHSSDLKLWDSGGRVSTTLGLNGTPSALLVAADGSIPADPVYGKAQIFELVSGIETAIAETQTPDIAEIINKTN